MDTSCPYSPFPGPHYGGRVPVRSCNISGAQNLSGFPRFPPGHRALGLQKLQVQRFHSRACLCRANAPGAILAGAPRGSPTQTRKLFLKPVGEDDSPYQGEMAQRARGDRELPLPPSFGSAPLSAAGAAISRPQAFPWGPTLLIKGPIPPIRGKWP